MDKSELTKEDISRVVEMAWEDRTPFEAILIQFSINESEVIKIMRRQLKPGSYRLWRKRVGGRKTKHQSLNDHKLLRHRAPTQQKHRPK